MAGQIFVAVRTGFTVLDGHEIVVKGRQTTAREGHPVLDAHPGLWQPLVPDFEVESKPVARAAAKVVAKDG